MNPEQFFEIKKKLAFQYHFESVDAGIYANTISGCTNAEFQHMINDWLNDIDISNYKFDKYSLHDIMTIEKCNTIQAIMIICASINDASAFSRLIFTNPRR